MKIAINGSFLIKTSGGIKEYIVNLVNGLLANNIHNYNFILYVTKDIDSDLLNEIDISDHIKIKRTPFKSYERVVRSLFERSFWLKEERVEQFEIFHSPFFHSPKFRVAKVVLTVHDLRFMRYPSSYEFKRYLYLKYAVRKSVKSCNHIISISEFTKSELIDLYNISSNKITVNLHGIDREKFSNKSILNDIKIPEGLCNSDFLLMVSHLEPRKNHIRLLKSFEILRLNPIYKDLKLVLVGQKSNGSKKILNSIASTENVIYLNFVDFSLLCWLYRNAKLFVFPSLYEGFGFPPIEASVFNLVSAVSNTSSIPEVCGKTSFYFNPLDVNDIYTTLLYCLSNSENFFAKKLSIEENLKRFSWKVNAEKVIAVYDSLKQDN